MVLDLPRTVCPHAHRGRDSADAGQGVRRAPRLRRRQAHCGGARGDAQGQSCCDLQWVRYLQQVRLAVREREPGERRDHYRLYDDTWYEAVTQRDEMLRRWQEDMREGIGAVGADTPARGRLEETRRFYAFLLDEMPRLMERWRKVRSEAAAEEGV
jgi:hypothetical protein